MKQIIKENLPIIINWAGSIILLVIFLTGAKECHTRFEDNTRVERQFYIDNGYVLCTYPGALDPKWVRSNECPFAPK